MLAYLGHTLLWIGFLAASCVTVWRLEVPNAPWQSIPWIPYVIAIAVGFVGAFLLRSTAAEAQQEDTRVSGEYATVRNSLDQLLSGIAELRGGIQDEDPQGIVDYIDDCLAEPFAEFADARNALIQRFGLHGFADVMTQFASGERFVNRAWSAAADGYIDEARASLERAHLHLDHAGQLLVSLEEGTSHHL
ncbi:MAG: hypothetical protein AAGF97_17760 [Planctomycetota bacterium]